MADQEQDAQAVWDDVAKEREAEESPSQTELQGQTQATDADKSEETETETEQVDAEANPAEETTSQTLSPELQARLARLDDLERQVGEIPRLIQHIKTADGRVAAIQREMEQAKAAAKVVANGPSAAQMAAARASTEKWDSLRKDFPEWADATEQFVKASLAGLTPQQTAQLDPQEVEAMVERRLTAVRAETAAALEVAKVEGKYENWREIVNTPEFGTWRKAQAPEVQNLAASDRGRDALRMLDLFHEAKSKPATEVAKERAAKLAAAASNKPGPSSTPVVKSLEDMTPAELWEYERKRAAKKSSATGRVY